MYRFILMPELESEGGQKRALRRIFYSVVLTSVEFFLAVLALLSGVPVLLDPVGLSLVPNSLAAFLPHWMVIFWGGMLTAGGTTTIAGITMGDYRIEQIGVLFLLAAAFVYAIALVSILPGSFVALITYILFVLAMTARYWVLSKLIRLTGRLVKKVREDEMKRRKE